VEDLQHELLRMHRIDFLMNRNSWYTNRSYGSINMEKYHAELEVDLYLAVDINLGRFRKYIRKLNKKRMLWS